MRLYVEFCASKNYLKNFHYRYCFSLNYVLYYISCLWGHAPLAQLDRASGYGPEGRGFESLTACHSRKTCFLIQSKGRFFPVTGKGHRSIVHNAAIRCNENLAMLVQIQPDSRQPNRLLIFFVYVHKQSARIFFSWNIVISDCVYFARYIAHPVSHNHHPSL